MSRQFFNGGLLLHKLPPFKVIIVSEKFPEHPLLAISVKAITSKVDFRRSLISYRRSAVHLGGYGTDLLDSRALCGSEPLGTGPNDL